MFVEPLLTNMGNWETLIEYAIWQIEYTIAQLAMNDDAIKTFIVCVCVSIESYKQWTDSFQIGIMYVATDHVVYVQWEKIISIQNSANDDC